MKKKLIISFTTIVIISVATVFWMESCKKAVGPVEPPEPPASTLYLKGKVVDFVTKEAIEGAQVKISDQFTESTDAKGAYSIEAEVVEGDRVEIRATATGYGIASTTASISTNATNVNTLMLMPLNNPVQIGVDGGDVESNNNEGLLGNTIRLEIPAGAYDNTVNISSTPLEGIHVPGYAPDSMLNLVTVHLVSDGGDPNVPLQLSFPLPFSAYLFDSLSVLKYDEQNNVWNFSGHYAQIDKQSSMAVSDIETMGTYSLSVAGSYNETFLDETDAGSKLLDKNSSSYEEAWMAKVAYPEGIPDSLSPNWLKNVVSQNTLFESGRVSFFDSTYTTFNYVPFRSDSLSSLKSTDYCVLWIWVPKTCYRWVRVVEYVRVYRWIDLNNNGIWDEGEPIYIVWVVNNIVWKWIMYDCSYWECIHDGGGGK
jgi:hypothetical protein